MYQQEGLIKIMGIGDWGLGIGDWGLGIGDWGHFDKLSASLGTGEK
ncbi:MAG: hypothetical protein HEQ35_14600 [Gloeotrichia echinulata IR180]|nr:hypothetical protein [Gloeotrichia echinulata DEX184]